MRQILITIVTALAALTACTNSNKKLTESETLETLKDSLESVVKEYPGEIGIALITDDGALLTVNNEDKYSLMSVFKLHQAISLCHLFEKRGISLDTVINLNLKKLNLDTWSPVLEEHSGEWLQISVREMLRYTLTQSDNNLSNYLFDSIQSVSDADKFMATIMPRDCFKMAVTEAQIWSDHSLSFENHSSPLAVAILLEKLFNENIISPEHKEFICTTLAECKTGDRIGAPLAGRDSITVAHKTGSGYRYDSGRLMAHNDAAYITLPDGSHYTLVVFVKDFGGTNQEAGQAISHISEIIYSTLYAE